MLNQEAGISLWVCVKEKLICTNLIQAKKLRAKYLVSVGASVAAWRMVKYFKKRNAAVSRTLLPGCVCSVQQRYMISVDCCSVGAMIARLEPIPPGRTLPSGVGT